MIHQLYTKLSDIFMNLKTPFMTQQTHTKQTHTKLTEIIMDFTSCTSELTCDEVKEEVKRELDHNSKIAPYILGMVAINFLSTDKKEGIVIQNDKSLNNGIGGTFDPGTGIVKISESKIRADDYGLLHELAHASMEYLYKNDCKPRESEAFKSEVIVPYLFTIADAFEINRDQVLQAYTDIGTEAGKGLFVRYRLGEMFSEGIYKWRSVNKNVEQAKQPFGDDTSVIIKQLSLLFVQNFYQENHLVSEFIATTMEHKVTGVIRHPPFEAFQKWLDDSFITDATEYISESSYCSKIGEIPGVVCKHVDTPEVCA